MEMSIILTITPVAQTHFFLYDCDFFLRIDKRKMALLLMCKAKKIVDTKGPGKNWFHPKMQRFIPNALKSTETDLIDAKWPALR